MQVRFAAAEDLREHQPEVVADLVEGLVNISFVCVLIR
jgi:hypothetical protein